MQIIGQFEQLNIDRTLSPVSATIEFKITVNPCTVTDFDIISAPDAQISYTLGEEGFTLDPYEFAMTPDCGYASTVRFKNMPSDVYMAFNESEKTFTIQ